MSNMGDFDDGCRGRMQSGTVVLASSSPRRIEMMEGSPFSFACLVPSVDESAAAGDTPEQLSVAAASLKARGALDLLSGDASIPVVACDTVVALDGQVFGKPSSAQDARRMLLELSGRTHEVSSGVCIIDSTCTIEFSCTTRVTFRELTPEEVDAYIATGEPFDKAGSYGIQGLGGRFVTDVEGDYDNVVGMPISSVVGKLESLNLRMADKQDIRRLMKVVRKLIPATEREKASLRACENLIGNPLFESARVVAAYTAFGSELDLRGMISQMPEGKTLTVPVTMCDRRMEFVEVDPEEILNGGSALPFISDPAGITEIPDSVRVVDVSDIDLVLAPGLAFDDLGFRMGYGGGYYDTYMSREGFGADVVGMYFDQQRFYGHLPVEEHDRPLPRVITQSDAVEFPLVDGSEKGSRG